MAKISKDLGAGTLHPRENLYVTGNLGALNAEIIVASDGAASVSIDLRGTFSMSVELSGTVDGTNWVPINVKGANTASKAYAGTITGTAAGVWMGACAGYRLVRARVTAYTSGTAVATLVSGLAILDQSLDGMVTPTLVTAVGASGAAVTLTLPSPGPGQRQYLTYLSINRFAAAVLTAAAAPVTVTTTNLPGSLAFSFAADAALQGTLDRWREDFTYPLSASTQSTATTVVCPATTGVIWRVTAGYYVAP